MEFFRRDMQHDESSMVRNDLILLENQLPYFIFDSLFSSSMKELYLSETIDQIILSFFGLKIEVKRNFKHFTDLFRCVYEASLDDIPKEMIRCPWKWLPMRELRNADDLSQAGVDFKIGSWTFGCEERPVRKRERVQGLSLHVKFEKCSLTMPAFHANEETDMYLRNVIAFEQCHDAVIPFTSNYIHFLNFLITSDRDVQLLSEKGVVTNTMGRPSLVVDMVNKLQVGVKLGNSSQYHYVAMKLSNMEPCIYRVPPEIRDKKPEAYTPRMVIIGPLHRSRKSTAKDGAETSSNPWHLKKKYMKMEVKKQKYLESFTKSVGKDTIEKMRKIIQTEEKIIRASYEESAEWISSEYYVDLILQDSVFIMEYVLSVMNQRKYSDDKIVDQPFYDSMVDDLILLENQLPYFILDSLFTFSTMKLNLRGTLDYHILSFFGLNIKEKTNFKHFTDMFRYVYEESLGDIPNQMKKHPRSWHPIRELRNVDNLSQAGVDFKSSLEEDEAFVSYSRTVPRKKRVEGRSLHVKFEKRILTMPGFFADEVSDMYLRNVIAFDQCHDCNIRVPKSSARVVFNYVVVVMNPRDIVISTLIINKMMFMD